MKLLVFLLLIVSCGQNDQQDIQRKFPNPKHVKKKEKEKDSDFDGISDKKEIERGSNPLISNIPVLESSSNKKMKLDFSLKLDGQENQFIESTLDCELNNNSSVRKLILAETLKDIYFEEESQDIPLHQFYMTKCSFSNSEFYKLKERLRPFLKLIRSVKGQIDFSFKFNLDKSKGEKFSNLTKSFITPYVWSELDQKLHPIGPQVLVDYDFGGPLYDFDSKGVSIDSFEVPSKYSEIPFFLGQVLKRPSFMFSVSNFQYLNKRGETFEFEKSKKVWAKKLSRVVISNSNETKSYFIVPNLSYREILELFFKNIRIRGRSEILSLDGLYNNRGRPVDLKKISFEQRKMKKWFVKGLSEFHEKLKPGKTLSLVHASYGEVLNLRPWKVVETKKLAEDQSINEIGVLPGDRVEMNFSVRKSQPVFYKENAHFKYSYEKDYNCRDDLKMNRCKYLIKEWGVGQYRRHGMPLLSQVNFLTSTNKGNNLGFILDGQRISLGDKSHFVEDPVLLNQNTTYRDIIKFPYSSLPDKEKNFKVQMTGEQPIEDVKIGFLQIVNASGRNKKGFKILDGYDHAQYVSANPKYLFKGFLTILRRD